MAHTATTLAALRERLTPRDMQIISFIEQAHCAFTHQLTRLFFTSASTEQAASKACRRNMQKLLEYKLVNKLDRKIGGYRAGSNANIWYLTDAGYKLLDLEDPDTPLKRRRFLEPSAITLRHRLTSVECYIQMVELERKVQLGGKVQPGGEAQLEKVQSAGKAQAEEAGDDDIISSTTSFNIRKVEFEPKSWKQYLYDNKNKYLRPDLFMSIEKDGYEYLYFIEIDLASESMTDIIRQCESYHDCYNSRAMQNEYDIFPIVLWIVPDEKRKERFVKVLKEQYERTNHLFTIITAEELQDFMLADIETIEFI